MSPRRLRAPAVARNRDAILAVLERALPAEGSVLEVASGTGEHACYFAQALPGLLWQPTDPDPDALESIAAWVEHAALPNLAPPLALDVCREPWPVARADVVVNINMIHIAPWRACEALMAGAARLLPGDGVLFMYGPYRVGGEHTAAGNAAFDASLRARDPAWGVRDLDEVVRCAAQHGLEVAYTVAMPANNLSVVYRRRGPGGGSASPPRISEA